jgi:hypothetical protein
MKITMPDAKPRRIKRAVSLFLLLLSGLYPASGMAVDVTPVYDLRFLGGQHFYDGEASALSGNAFVLVSPAMKFNDKWSLIPTYMAGYQGTRDVQELAGGGTLFQDSTTQGLTLKGIYGLTPAWKLKATVGTRFEYLRETKDEKFGKGLFDYRKHTGGFETQYDLSERSGGRVAYDFYTLDFPNYTSLESSQDSTLSRELAGKDTLNSNNHMFTLSGWSPVPGGARLEVSAYYNQRSFSDQPLVLASGDLASADREDDLMAASGSFAWPWALGENLRFVGELGFGYGTNDSNQAHYDARKTVFIKDYYDYSQISVSPRVTAALGDKPWIVSAGVTHTQRSYDERPTQDANGDYLAEKINIRDITASLGVSYPLTQNFRARTVATLGWSDSNQKYEKVFRYNYKIANYMFGFSYEY